MTEGMKKVFEALKGVDLQTVPGEFKAVDILTNMKIAESRSEARRIIWGVRKKQQEQEAELLRLAEKVVLAPAKTLSDEELKKWSVAVATDMVNGESLD